MFSNKLFLSLLYWSILSIDEKCRNGNRVTEALTVTSDIGMLCKQHRQN